MKRIILAACSLAVLVACNSGDGGKSAGGDAKNDAGKSTANSNASNPDYQKGLELLGKNDCATCHKPREQFLGPSYEAIADKYAGEGASAIPKLADKIIKGGSGVWGATLMTPHAGLSQADAEALVKYIFLLKK